MYGAIPGGGVIGGGALVLTGGSMTSTVFGIAIVAIALGIFLLLMMRERRRLRYLAATGLAPVSTVRRAGVLERGA